MYEVWAGLARPHRRRGSRIRRPGGRRVAPALRVSRPGRGDAVSWSTAALFVMLCWSEAWSCTVCSAG